MVTVGYRTPGRVRTTRAATRDARSLVLSRRLSQRDPTPVSACAVCGAVTVRLRHDWLRRCPRCAFLSSTLAVRVNSSAGAIDEDARARALSALRRRNFERVLDALGAAGLKTGARVLDVGCAHGWFVEAAVARGYDACGLEPDTELVAVARRTGVPVRSGFFPDALAPDERFDAIVFNDVFEHLPRPDEAMRAVRMRLRAGGLTAINLPIASGVFYRMADVLDRVGWHAAFDRMWQTAFPSPHVSYFTQALLARLAAACEMDERWRGHLPSLDHSGLWARLRYDRTATVAGSAVIWGVLRLAMPILARLPPDIGLQIFGTPGFNEAAS